MDTTVDAKARQSKSRANKVLIGCILLIAVEYGTLNILSLYIEPICTTLGVDATAVSFMFTITNIVSVASGFLVALLIEKVNLRLIMFTGVICFMLFFGILYVATSIVMIYVGAVFYGVSQVFVGFAVTQPLISWWHAKNVGMKMSSLSLAMSVGALIMAPTIGSALPALGMPGTVLVNGGVLGVLMLIAVAFLISGKPETYGLKPYGYEEAQEEVAQEELAGEASVASGLTFKQCLKTYPFWAILFVPFLLYIPGNGFVTNEAVIFQSCGFDSGGVSMLMSVYSGCMIVWVLLYGFLSDHIGPAKASIIYAIGGIVCLLGFVILGGQAGAIFLAVTIGIINSFSGMIAAIMFGKLFGTRAVGTLIAVGNIVGGVAAAVAPPIASFINAATGSFTAFMVLSAVIVVVVLFLLVTATSKRQVARIQALEASGE